jgi:methyl-accepting chemotaxis protein
VLFSEINAVMANAAKGDFSTRVTMQTSGIYLVLKNSVNAAMDNLNAAISDVLRASDSLSKNNLTQLVEGNHHGDLEKLKVGMNTAIAALNQSFGLVRAQTQEVAISSTQVAQANNNLSKRIQEQAVALEETASAMEELTAQVYQSAQHASNASCLAKESQSHVQQGAAAMTEAIDAMDGIRLVSKQITGIITIIDSIAFQTNLLALNAAVEAARAGEHGRGFAVVASEVRSLAQKSADAAKEIKQLIDVTSAKINEGTQKVKTTGASLTMITGKFDQMVVLVEQITHNANEQAQGLGQTNTAIAKIDHAVQQGASAVQENASLAQYLGEVANNLDQMSARFQINQQLSALPVELDDESLPLALVVEDNLPSQKIAVALLKRQGYRVDTADSGRAAVELASRKSYTVILMDIEMRDGNGLNATEKLRQMGVTSTIIAVTATKGHLQATIDAGMDGFILKPITPQELEGVLVSIRR